MVRFVSLYEHKNNLERIPKLIFTGVVLNVVIFIPIRIVVVVAAVVVMITIITIIFVVDVVVDIITLNCFIIITGKDSNYDTDIFVPIFEVIVFLIITIK